MARKTQVQPIVLEYLRKHGAGTYNTGLIAKLTGLDRSKVDRSLAYLMVRRPELGISRISPGMYTYNPGAAVSADAAVPTDGKDLVDGFQRVEALSNGKYLLYNGKLYREVSL